MKVYAHAQPEEENDVSFADFDAPARPYAAPPSSPLHSNISQVRETAGAPGTTRTCDTRFRKLRDTGVRGSRRRLGALWVAKPGKAWSYESDRKLRKKQHPVFSRTRRDPRH
jgi:hypothetical protein